MLDFLDKIIQLELHFDTIINNAWFQHHQFSKKYVSFE